MLRGLLDESRDGLVALDERGTIIQANLAAAAMLGHRRPRLIGKPLAAMVVLDDRRIFRNALARVAPEGARVDVRLHNDPKARTLSLRPLRHVAPRTILVSLSHREEEPPRPPPRPSTMTDRLERLALRFPYGVIAVLADGRVAFANTHARKLLGRDAVKTGAHFGETVPDALRALVRRLTQIPAPLHSTFVELPDDRVVRVSGLAATVDEPAIMLIEDATEQRRHERVAREFLRNAAHQLRTPLAGITAAIETLQAGAKERPAERDRFLGHLETHVARLTRIARGLLVLARAQMGERLHVDFVELRPLLEEVAASVEPKPGVGVRLDCDPSLAAIAARELLQEALAAIVENAAAHTYEGEVQLAAAASHGRVTISVTDRGAGIPPEFRERVFEPFFRIGDDGRGYGLGLAIAAQAIDSMDGEIGVSSGPEGGTTFNVTLRAATVVR